MKFVNLPAKTPKTEVLRARCEEELKKSVVQAARLYQLDEADIIRIACTNYVRQIAAPPPLPYAQ